MKILSLCLPETDPSQKLGEDRNQILPEMKVDSIAGTLKSEYRFTVLIKYGAHNLSSKEWISILDPKGED